MSCLVEEGAQNLISHLCMQMQGSSNKFPYWVRTSTVLTRSRVRSSAVLVRGESIEGPILRTLQPSENAYLSYTMNQSAYCAKCRRTLPLSVFGDSSCLSWKTCSVCREALKKVCSDCSVWNCSVRMLLPVQSADLTSRSGLILE